MFIIALTPIVGLAFPALTPLIFATAGALGYKVMHDMKDGGDLNDQLRQRLEETTTVQTKVDDLVLDAMEEEVRHGESLRFEKDGLELLVTKNARGKLNIFVTAGKDSNRKDLEKAGHDFAEELAQLFAYNAAVSASETMNAEVIEETVNEEGERVLRVARWRE